MKNVLEEGLLENEHIALNITIYHVTKQQIDNWGRLLEAWLREGYRYFLELHIVPDVTKTSSNNCLIFTSVSVDSSPRSYLSTSATVRIPVHTATRSGKNLSGMYWRIHFQIVASHLRSVTEISPKSPFYKCEKKPHPAWFRVSAQSYQLGYGNSLIFITGLMQI